MKFLHVGDLHIGLKLYKYDLMEDQKEILRQIIEIADTKKPGAVLIAGDVYDKAIPSAEALELFDWFVSELTTVLPEAEIMIISGNHDSASRVNLYRNTLESLYL